MEYMLESIPDEMSLSAKNLFDRLTLSKKQFFTIRKNLYEGLFIIRDPMNKYRRVQERPHITKQFARKYILRRIMRNFGIFSIEGLSAYLKGEFKVKELRTLLRELESEGELVKGYFRQDDDSLYWLQLDGIKRLENDNMRYNDYLIITPQDQLATYLAPVMRQRFGPGPYNIIFKGFEIVGAFRFKHKQSLKKVWVMEFFGDDQAKHAMEDWFRINKLELVDEETEELYADEE